MCAVRCHFGPCPPCSKKDVTARCKCGNVRQQLPCAQVWIEGKQLVLECIEDCKKKLPAPTEIEAQPVLESCDMSQVEVANSVEPDSSELRQRLKDTKRKKREEEIEERRQQELKKEQALLRKKRCRILTIVLWVLVMGAALIVFVQVLRAREDEGVEEEFRTRKGRDERHRRSRGGH